MLDQDTVGSAALCAGTSHNLLFNLPLAAIAVGLLYWLLQQQETKIKQALGLRSEQRRAASGAACGCHTAMCLPSFCMPAAGCITAVPVLHSGRWATKCKVVLVKALLTLALYPGSAPACTPIQREASEGQQQGQRPVEGPRGVLCGHRCMGGLVRQHHAGGIPSWPEGSCLPERYTALLWATTST